MSTLSNCVWLKALYASARNCKLKRSVNLMFLKSERSQLLMPGPRATTAPALPMQAMPVLVHRGGPKAALLKYWLMLRLSFGNTG